MVTTGGKKDVVKTSEEKEDVPPVSEEVKEEKKDPQLLTLEDIREHIRSIERSVSCKENRFLIRVIRSLPSTRRRLSSGILRKLLSGYYSTSGQKEKREELLEYLPAQEEDTAMEVDEKTPAQSQKRASKSPGALLPEVDIYLHLLVLLFLLNNAKEEEGGSKGSLESLIPCSAALIDKITAQNRRTLDPLAGKCYYFHSRVYELAGELHQIRAFLHARLRTATLKNDIEGQAILINCLLRNYLHYNLYDQADKLVSKATFPDTASNNECARYLYYLGRIKAIQLEYSEAHKHLVQSLRKAPQYSVWGFRHTVEKLRITVELLLGDIPERQTFLLTKNKSALAPYFYLTQAVRSGDVKRFQDVLDNHTKLFQSDHTFTLILRLRHNVVRTAVRSISLAYSRISLEDVAKKLRLSSAVDAESVIAKAIRDGVIEATIDHENGWMQSKENSDIYCTREPQLAFHQRIEFCLDLHNNSVKAMRFPPKSYNKDLESAEDRREREAQDLELAKEMAEEDDDII